MYYLFPKRFASWQTASRSGVADLTGDDLILCQITNRSRRDGYSVPLATGDFERGHLNIDRFIRVSRLFTVEQSVILYSAAKVKSSKLNEVRGKIACRIFIDFANVALISSSFADELIGKLFVELGPMTFISRLKLLGMSPTVQQLIDRAISQRMAVGLTSTPKNL